MSDKEGYINVHDLPDACKKTQTDGTRIHIDRVARQLSMAPSVNGKKVGIRISNASRVDTNPCSVAQVWVQLTKESFLDHMDSS